MKVDRETKELIVAGTSFLAVIAGVFIGHKATKVATKGDNYTPTEEEKQQAFSKNYSSNLQEGYDDAKLDHIERMTRNSGVDGGKHLIVPKYDVIHSAWKESQESGDPEKLRNVLEGHSKPL